MQARMNIQGAVYVNKISMLSWILKEIHTNGVAIATYQDEDNHRRLDILGYAKRYLGMDPWDKERNNPALLSMAQQLGFERSKAGMMALARWNDETSVQHIIARFGEAIKAETN